MTTTAIKTACPKWCDRQHVEVDGLTRHSVTEQAPGFGRMPIEVRLLQEGEEVVLNVGAEAYLYLDQVEALVHTITRVANRERGCRFSADVARRVSEVIGGPDPLLRIDVVAEATGISRGVLSRRLLGESPFTVNELAGIAQHLGIGIAELLPTRANGGQR